MPKIFATISLLLCLLSTPLFAQQPGQNIEEADPLADMAVLDTLIAQSLRTSPLLQELEYKLGQEREQLSVARLSWLSGVQLGVQLFSVTQQAATDGGTTTIGVLPSVGGTMQIGLFQLFTIGQRIRTAQYGIKRAEESMRVVEQDLAVRISSKYLDYLQTIEQAKTTLDILASQEELLRIARKRFERSEGKIEDCLMAQSSVQQAKEALIRYRITAEKALRELQLLSGRIPIPR